MEILIKLVPLVLMVLFIFAILLLIIALIHYASYLLGKNSQTKSRFGRRIHALWYFSHADLSGRLSYLKIFIASITIAVLVYFVAFIFM